MSDQEKILEILKSVRDPARQKDIVSLGMLRELRVNDGYVFVHLELPLNTESLRQYFKQQILERTGGLGGIKEVAVEFSRLKTPGGEFEGPVSLPDVSHVIAVASGKGGVGKTTVAVNLAMAFSRMSYRVGLMDADIYGPNVPLMLGVDSGARPVRGEEDRIVPLEAQGLRMISMGILVPAGQPMVWRGSKLHGVISQFVRRVDWGTLDYLLVDLPPGTGDVQLSLVQNVSLSGAVIVTTPQEVSLMDVRKGIAMFQKMQVPILGVIENMTGEIFGSGGGRRAAEETGVPFLGQIPLDAGIRRGGDGGCPVVTADPDHPAAKAFMDAARLLTQSTLQIKI
jgi:ATP-binding protein involved in chromosome partitioning